jgi:hypothetical protein
MANDPAWVLSAGADSLTDPGNCGTIDPTGMGPHPREL